MKISQNTSGQNLGGLRAPSREGVDYSEWRGTLGNFRVSAINNNNSRENVARMSNVDEFSRGY